MTFLAPNLSANIPIKGWVRPQRIFCKAIAKAKVSRPQPRDWDMGCKNNPKLSRIPIAKARIEVPKTMIRSAEILVEFMK
jgi:hypothetical protein